MTKDPFNATPSRNWRDIPQPIKPRTMSRGGRWRLAFAGVRTAFAVAICGGLAWGGWKIAGVLLEAPQATTSATKAVPLKVPELSTDGVLDHAWLERTLALPKNATLMELDLAKLRTRLLADRQVLTVSLARHFPDRLGVHLTERLPVARVMAEWRGMQQPLLVARDGTVFAGTGYEADMLATLPWLDGMKMVRRGDSFLPIEGMEKTSELLAKARLEAEHLYRSWNVVSLARLADDRLIEVRTHEGLTIVFNAGSDDFFRQLAKLDYLWSEVGRVTATTARIDLSFGREVPVMIELAPPAAPESARPTGMKESATPRFFISTAVQAKTKREL